jgi:hypothetical protein
MMQTVLYVHRLRRREEALAIACAVLRFAVCCYRAAHQAIIVDEATTFNKFISGPWLKLFGRYDANNHILSSLFIKATVAVAGVSEFKLRLPSLLAGLFLTLGVFWLLKQVEWWPLRWTAFALFCLSPILLDFSIAARGYSISLAFFVWAIYFCTQQNYLPAGCLLGLSFAANLAIFFPLSALIVVIAILEKHWKPILKLAVPALLLGALITAPSLRRAHRADFYIGYRDLRTAVASLASTTLHARDDRDGILGTRDTAERIGVIALPIFLLLAGGAAFLAKDRRQLIPFLTLIVTIAELILAHWLFDLNYPADRTCLYFVILAAISWAIAGDVSKYRVLWLLPMLIVVIQFSTQLQMHYFQFWRLEEDDKLIATLIQQASFGKDSLTVSSSWMHQPTLEFYRRYLQITALKPVERFDPAPVTGFDFYVLSWGDVDRAKQANLRAVFSNPEIPIVLAVP